MVLDTHSLAGPLCRSRQSRHRPRFPLISEAPVKSADDSLEDAAVFADVFHLVRLALQALDEIPRPRQQQIHGRYAGDVVKADHRVSTRSVGVEPFEDAVEDLLAAELALGESVAALALQEWAEIDGGLGEGVQDSQIDSKWESSTTGRAQ